MAGTSDEGTAPHCELCEAAALTEWFFEDDECWIAECESCSVPMVVWRTHDPSPSEAVKERLWGHLNDVVAAEYQFDHYIDDRLRTIPTHYHAHARPRDPFNRQARRRPRSQ
jgi:hypothetical protein